MPSSPASSSTRREQGALAIAAGLLALLGPVLQVWGHGQQARTAALTLVLVVTLVQGLMVVARGRVVSVAALVLLAPIAMVTAGATIGRAPCLQATAVLGLSNWALTGDPTLVRPGAGRPARLAVPVLVVSQVLFLRSHVAVAFALVVVAAAVATWTQLRPAAADRTEGLAARALGRLGEVLGVGVMAVLLLPVFLIGAIGRRIRRDPPTGWQSVPSVVDPATAARRQFIPIPPRQAARRRAVLGVGAVVVVAIGATVAVRTWADDPSSGDVAAPTRVVLSDRSDVPYSELDAFDGAAFADQLQQDQGRISPDLATEHVNIRDGERRTIEPPACDCTPLEVWVVGGSTVFGIGQRDDHTIASELVRLAAEDGHSVRVRNLGWPGWTYHQEVEAVQRALDEGGVAPDVVVHVHGFNDVLARVVAGDSGVLDGDAVLDYLERAANGRASTSRPGAAAAVLTDFETTAMEESARLDAVGATLVRVLQPDALAAPGQLEHTPLAAALGADRLLRSGLADALRRVEDGVPGDVIDLRALFEDRTEPIMLDLVHTNELGARLVAERVYSALSSELPTTG